MRLMMPPFVFAELVPIESLLNDPVKRRLLALAAALIALAVLLALVRQVFKWSTRPVRLSPPDQSLFIDLASLPLAQPGRTRLTVYHVPVRMAVVIIAPLGRDSDPPKHSDVPNLLDGIVPGLAHVMVQDPTIVKIWPVQLSATGFAPSLLRNVPLPGERAERTPWCLVAGRTTYRGASFAVGLALAAAAPNKLGLIVIENDHQWLDVLRLTDV